MTARSALLSLGLAFLASGCFTVEHRLPPHAYFGRLPAQPGETAREFENHAMKNWYLAGLGAWSKFSTRDLVEADPHVRRIEALEIGTRFAPIDVLVWVIPGQVYGYYFWAPRTLSIRGREIRGE
jgi:hypothetical protein